MTYAFDPELATAVPALPVTDLGDLDVAQAMCVELARELGVVVVSLPPRAGDALPRPARTVRSLHLVHKGRSSRRAPAAKALPAQTSETRIGQQRRPTHRTPHSLRVGLLYVV
jgi:hypothetical protein